MNSVLNKLYLSKKFHFSQIWWCMPVIPDIYEAEAG